jgi:hypothetical protein
VPAIKRMATEYPAQLMEGDVEWRDVARDVNRILGTAGLFNSTIAGAASISNLAKDVFEVTSANLPDLIDKMDGGWKDQRVQQDDE